MKGKSDLKAIEPIVSSSFVRKKFEQRFHKKILCFRKFLRLYSCLEKYAIEGRMMFSAFSRKMALLLGSSYTFVLACLMVLAWLTTGPIFKFSDAWQLVINTGTTIITFLMVFIIQNTQNHDTIALHLKLDEMIRALKGAHNELLKIEELNDQELADLCDRYECLAKKTRERLKKGKPDIDTPKV